MTLNEAADLFHVNGLHREQLHDQEGAFAVCLDFLAGVGKTKGQNERRSSYGLKHIVERPSGRFGMPRAPEVYRGFIYEGTFILAALASGFSMKQLGQSLRSTFNISERSFRQRARDFAQSSNTAGR